MRSTSQPAPTVPPQQQQEQRQTRIVRHDVPPPPSGYVAMSVAAASSSSSTAIAAPVHATSIQPQQQQPRPMMVVDAELESALNRNNRPDPRIVNDSLSPTYDDDHKHRDSDGVALVPFGSASGSGSQLSAVHTQTHSLLGDVALAVGTMPAIGGFEALHHHHHHLSAFPGLEATHHDDASFAGQGIPVVVDIHDENGAWFNISQESDTESVDGSSLSMVEAPAS